MIQYTALNNKYPASKAISIAKIESTDIVIVGNIECIADTYSLTVVIVDTKCESTEMLGSLLTK